MSKVYERIIVPLTRREPMNGHAYRNMLNKISMKKISSFFKRKIAVARVCAYLGERKYRRERRVL